MTSDPAPVPSRSYGGGAFDWLPDGSGLVYAAADGGLWLTPVDGGIARCVIAPQPAGPVSSPAVAPDGTTVACVIDSHYVAVASLADDGSWPVRLSGDVDFCFDPSFTTDSQWVAWQQWSVPDMSWDMSEIAARRADGSGEILERVLGARCPGPAGPLRSRGPARRLPDRCRRVSEPLGVRPRLQREAARRRAVRARRPGLGPWPAVVCLVARWLPHRVQPQRGRVRPPLRRRRRHGRGRGSREGRARIAHVGGRSPRRASQWRAHADRDRRLRREVATRRASLAARSAVSSRLVSSSPSSSSGSAMTAAPCTVVSIAPRRRRPVPIRRR